MVMRSSPRRLRRDTTRLRSSPVSRRRRFSMKRHQVLPPRTKTDDGFSRVGPSTPLTSYRTRRCVPASRWIAAATSSRPSKLRTFDLEDERAARVDHGAVEVDDGGALFAVGAVLALFEVNHLARAVIADGPRADDGVVGALRQLLFDDARQRGKLLLTHGCSSAVIVLRSVFA